MKAYLLHGKKDLRREDIPDPVPGPGEVLVKVRSAGICGSDIHYYQQGRVGDYVPLNPFVPGHEFSGDVAQTGINVSEIKVGIRVAVDPSQPCGLCSYCRTGHYNLCENMKYFGAASVVPHLNGAFAEYVVVPERNCFPLPDSVSFIEAALLEPLSVAMQAVVRSGIITGKSVMITGGGTIGQLILLAAKASGAGKIIVSEIMEYQRNFALQMGADAVLNPQDQSMESEVDELAKSGFDIIFEASGAEQAINLALRLVRRGGTIVQLGVLPDKIHIPGNLIMTKELSVMGSFRFANVFDLALNMVASGEIKVKPLVTQIIPFDRLIEGIELASSRKNVIKVEIES